MSSAHHELPRTALLEMIAGAAAISTTSLFVKVAHVGPTVSAFYRMAFGGGMLLLGLVALRQWRRVRPSEIAWLLIPGIAFAADLMLWHRSILYVGPGLAPLLGNFQVFLMALAGFLIYRGRLGWQFLAGVALAFVGLYLLVGLDWNRVGTQYKLGVILGAFIIVYLPNFFLGRSDLFGIPIDGNAIADYKYLFFGLALMTLMIFRPQGLFPARQKLLSYGREVYVVARKAALAAAGRLPAADEDGAR